MPTGGQLLVRCLEVQGVERLFCVPGESFLPVLDALHDSSIRTVAARQEGGAAMMAEADGKLAGRPGVCLVTRGPGATNAAAGVHVAQQDSTPMVLLVGQIGRGVRGRDAFQELNLGQTFGSLAKWVDQIDDPGRIPEVVTHAWHTAVNGRPGPVVLGLPEDMLRDEASESPGLRVDPTDTAPTPDQLGRLEELLRAAERPLLVLGGSRWTAKSVATATDFAERWGLPTAVTFRRQQLFDHLHDHYAGEFGLGANPRLAERVRESDLVLLLGARFSENPSQGFSLLDIPTPAQKLVHVLSGPAELGRIYHPTLAINATPSGFLAAASTLGAGGSSPHRAREAHDEYLAWSACRTNETTKAGTVLLADVMRHLEEVLPRDAVITNGAGNYTGWVHRFHRYRGHGTQVAATSGSMGYGLPAAIAAKLADPTRTVICFAGDGCFQMTGQELATAVQYGANVIVLVVDNGSYGTIRMHQERNYPGRKIATDLINPDFAALARAYGATGETVTDLDAFEAAFAAANSADRPALLHIKTDLRLISPTMTLD